MKNDSLSDSFAACRISTRQHARSFYFASHTLPKEKRNAAYAIYSFCRYLDDQVDLAPGDDARAKAIADLRIFVNQLFASNNFVLKSNLTWLPAFQQTVARYQIPPSYFFDLLTGVEMDHGKVRLQTWEELNHYCYYVAGVVGLMMVKVLADSPEDLSAPALNLGIAMQLTNILRDVKEDYQRDRIYLPKDEMDRFGVTENDIASGQLNAPLISLLQFQISRARDYYKKSENGIIALPRDGSQLTVWLMRTIYAEILHEIEKADYQIFRKRVFVSTPRKIFLALKAWNLYRKS